MATKQKPPIRRKGANPAAQASHAKTRRGPAAAPDLPILALYRARQKMREQIAKDRAQRFRSFLRQVKNPTELPKPGVALRAIAPTPGKQNLRILAEGDCWFEYPLPAPRGDGVIYHLQNLLSYRIANMAHHGLEMEQMMGLSIRQEIISRLDNRHVKFDAMLFSGGGNDLVGDQFCIWLKDAPPVVPPNQMLDLRAVEAAMGILEAEYREMIDIRDQYSAQTVIFAQCYDFPPVTGYGVCGIGPWLKPSLDFAYKQMGVANPNPADEFLVVKTLLQMFCTMLKRIAADPKVKRFVVVPTQGILTPDASDWQNEIHPSSRGFAKIAQEFKVSLASVFP